MLRNNIKNGDIVDEYKCRPSFVSEFLNGKKTSQGLVDYLKEKGCPEKYFKNGRVAA